MKTRAVVGLDRGSTGNKRLLATVDEPGCRIERRLDECVRATTGRAWFSSEGA
jgi:hypothetical protein